MTAARDEAKTLFADMYAPLIGPETPAKNIFAAAEALELAGQVARAAELYQLFLEVQGKDRSLIDFIADPRPLLQATADIAAPGNTFDLAGPFNPAYKPEAKGKDQKIWEQALFADYLYDADDFRAAMAKRLNLEENNIRKEEKRNFGVALQALRVYRSKLYEPKKRVLQQHFDAGIKAIDKLEGLVTEAYLRYEVTERLLNFFRDGDEPQQAIPLARELFAYDPSRVRFQSAMVDTVLISHRETGDAGGGLTEPLEEALTIAVNLRKRFRDGTDTVGYWNARVQVLELQVALGQIESVRDKTLALQLASRSFPWLECFEVFDQALESGIAGQTWISIDDVPWTSFHDGQVWSMGQRMVKRWRWAE